MTPTFSNQQWLEWFGDPFQLSHSLSPPAMSPHNRSHDSQSSLQETKLKDSGNNYKLSFRRHYTSSGHGRSMASAPRKQSSLEHYKRRTYPPATRRVLKKEHQHFITGSNTRRETKRWRRRHSSLFYFVPFVYSASSPSFGPSGNRPQSDGFFSDSTRHTVRTSMMLRHNSWCSSTDRKGGLFSHWRPYTNRPPLLHQETDMSSLSMYSISPSLGNTTTFSAVWKSQSGKSGKQVIHVDEKGRATVGCGWKTWGREQSVNVLALLFLMGFLICPFWWLGAALYLSRSTSFDTEVASLWTPRTFGHLNCWMSVTSLLLLGGIAGVVIWYHSA